MLISSTCRIVRIRKVLEGSCNEDVQILKEPPQDGEHESLQTVRQNTGLQPTPEQANQAVSRNYLSSSIEVADAGLVDLPVGLDDAKRVRDRIRGNGRAESDECPTAEFLKEGVRLRQICFEIVERGEPLKI
jgi:hypothetical protein